MCKALTDGQHLATLVTRQMGLLFVRAIGMSVVTILLASLTTILQGVTEGLPVIMLTCHDTACGQRPVKIHFIHHAARYMLHVSVVGKASQ